MRNTFVWAAVVPAIVLASPAHAQWAVTGEQGDLGPFVEDAPVASLNQLDSDRDRRFRTNDLALMVLPSIWLLP